MIIVAIQGGLGNQMFQYAVGKALSNRLNSTLKLDISAYETYPLRNYELGIFNIDNNIASSVEIAAIKKGKMGVFKKLLSLLQKKKTSCSQQYFQEKFFQFDPEVIDLQDEKYLFGYWQTEKYFLDYEKELRKDFTLRYKLSDRAEAIRESMALSNAISLHIRRGDYVNNATTNSYHGVCSLDYYKEAVNYIVEHVENTHFYIFSDDLDWAKKNLDFIDEISFVELEDKDPDYEEMFLMSQCQHNIIANSSFSWWGAWLNQNKNKIVIAPKKWFGDPSIDTNDLIPESWKRI